MLPLHPEFHQVSMAQLVVRMMSTKSKSTHRSFTRRAFAHLSFPFKAFVVVGWPVHWRFGVVTIALLELGGAADYNYVALPAKHNTADAITGLYALCAVALLALGAAEAVLRFQAQESKTFLFFLVAVFGTLWGCRGYVVA